MRAAVAAENRIVRQLLRQGTEYPLRVDRVGWLFGLAPGFLATGRHRPLDPAAPGTVLFLLEQRQQALQGFPCIAEQGLVDRIADTDVARIQVDLHRPRLAGLG